ncbi:MAG: RNA-splicing ligase RtcB [Ignavibacterium sp.]
MTIVKGKYNTAVIFTDLLEQEAREQIMSLCNMEVFKNSKIRIMPDVHAGKGCTIGTTISIHDAVVPNLVGVDIGCGVDVCKIHEKEIDFACFDKIIYDFIPYGQNIHKEEHPYTKNVALESLRCKNSLNLDRAKHSIGTLGGGNHFIEIDKDFNGFLYIIVHSGSRYLGKQVCEHYQRLAYKELTNCNTKKEKQEIIKELRNQGREKEIQTFLENLEKPEVKKDLAYLKGQNFKDYLHDMKIVQDFAVLNRKAIVDKIIQEMKFTVTERFTTTHNYIDTERMILRKGAISASKEEKIIIPLNMRDGNIIAAGKGNSDWNYSAPHGAGRLLSRNQAKKSIKIEDFVDSMKDIYSTTINAETLDEAPTAYKPMEEIISKISETVQTVQVIKPIYNFKAST